MTGGDLGMSVAIAACDGNIKLWSKDGVGEPESM